MNAHTNHQDELSPKERARLERRKKTMKLGLLGVAVPTLAAILYYAFITPPQYTSETQFTIQSVQRQPTSIGLLGSLGIPAVAGGGNDGRIVVEYVRSPAMVRALQENGGFNEAYRQFSLDPSARLSSKASIERSTAFWRKKVKVQYDVAANTVLVAVSANRPEDALRLTRGVLAASSIVVNSLNSQAHSLQLESARKELEAKRADYDATRNKIVAVRGQRAIGVLDAQAQQSAQMVGQIDAQIATLRVQQAVTSATFQPGSPQAQALDQQISSLQAEREKALARSLAGPGAAAASSDFAGQAVMLEYEAAQKVYYMSLESLRQVSLQQDSEKRFIVSFVPPQLPESSNYWKRFSHVIAVAIGAAIILGTATLTYSVIRDHVQ